MTWLEDAMKQAQENVADKNPEAAEKTGQEAQVPKEKEAREASVKALAEMRLENLKKDTFDFERIKNIISVITLSNVEWPGNNVFDEEEVKKLAGKMRGMLKEDDVKFIHDTFLKYLPEDVKKDLTPEDSVRHFCMIFGGIALIDLQNLVKEGGYESFLTANPDIVPNTKYQFKFSGEKIERFQVIFSKPEDQEKFNKSKEEQKAGEIVDAAKVEVLPGGTWQERLTALQGSSFAFIIAMFGEDTDANGNPIDPLEYIARNPASTGGLIAAVFGVEGFGKMLELLEKIVTKVSPGTQPIFNSLKSIKESLSDAVGFLGGEEEVNAGEQVKMNREAFGKQVAKGIQLKNETILTESFSVDSVEGDFLRIDLPANSTITIPRDKKYAYVTDADFQKGERPREINSDGVVLNSGDGPFIVAQLPSEIVFPVGTKLKMWDAALLSPSK